MVIKRVGTSEGLKKAGIKIASVFFFDMSNIVCQALCV
jgi:hypothetical protein